MKMSIIWRNSKTKNKKFNKLLYNILTKNIDSNSDNKVVLNDPYKSLIFDINLAAKELTDTNVYQENQPKFKLLEDTLLNKMK